MNNLIQEKQKGNLYLAQDTPGWISQIIGEDVQDCNTSMLYINQYFCRLQEILGSDFETVTAVSQNEIDNKLIELIGESIPVVMDRYLLNQFPCNRLEFSRYADGFKGPRPGADSIQDQLESLTNALSNEIDVVLVDDGTFTGGSLQYGADILEGIGINITRKVCYFYNPDFEINNLEAYQPLENMIDWIDSRDLSVLGGRYMNLDSDITVTVPYIAPFSDGENASLQGRDFFPEMSRSLIESEYRLFESLDLLGLNFAYLKSRGFVPPICKGDVPSDDLSLGNYFKNLIN